MRRLCAVVEAKDAEIGVLRGELAAERELRLAEVERRSMDSSDSGMPSSRERIGAREARQGAAAVGVGAR